MARRKKKPHVPGKDKVPAHLESEIKQLGLPANEDISAFEVDNLAPASPHGILRARRKTLFMLPEQRKALIEQALKEMQAKGDFEIKAEDVLLPETSIDRNFTPGEYDAICWFLRVHAKVEGTGSPSITSYEGKGRGSSHNKLPFSEKEQFDRREYAYIAARLPEAHLVFLTWIAWCMFPEEFSSTGRPPSKVEYAGRLYDADDAKYLRGAADGNFKAICQNIAHWRGDYETWQRRTALIHKDYENFRKKSLTALSGA